MITNEKYDEIIKDGIRKLKKDNQFSLQFINANLPTEQGFIDVAISRHKDHVKAWNRQLPEYYRPCTLEEMVTEFDKLGFEASVVLSLDSFKDIIGFRPKIVRKEDEFQFMLIAQDRVSLAFINKDWNDLEEMYGSYLRPTKH